MRKSVLLAPLAIVAAVAVYAGRGMSGGGETVSEKPPERFQVRLSSVDSTIRAEGPLEPAASSELSFPYAGNVSEVLVELGDTVDAGQTLLRLDSVELRLAVAAAEATVRQAEANVSLAQLNLETLTNGSSEADLEDARESVARDEAQLDNAVAQADLARLKLDQSTLTAPFAGTVMEISAQPNVSIGAGETAVTIADLAQLQVELLVDQQNIARVAVDSPARISVSASPFRLLEGRVLSVAPTPKEVAGEVLYPVTIGTETKGVPLRAGMTADVTIVTSHKLPTITIPLRAVRSGAGRNTVEIIARSSLPKEARGATVFAGFGMYGGFGPGNEKYGGYGQGSDDVEGADQENDEFGGFGQGSGDFGGFGAGETSEAADGQPDVGAADRRNTPGAPSWPWGGSWGDPWGWHAAFAELPTLEELGSQLDGLPTRLIEVSLGPIDGNDVTVLEGLWHGDIVIIPRALTAAGE